MYTSRRVLQVPHACTVRGGGFKNIERIPGVHDTLLACLADVKAGKTAMDSGEVQSYVVELALETKTQGTVTLRWVGSKQDEEVRQELLERGLPSPAIELVGVPPELLGKDAEAIAAADALNRGAEDLMARLVPRLAADRFPMPRPWLPPHTVCIGKTGIPLFDYGDAVSVCERGGNVAAAVSLLAPPVTPPTRRAFVAVGEGGERIQVVLPECFDGCTPPTTLLENMTHVCHHVDAKDTEQVPKTAGVAVASTVHAARTMAFHPPECLASVGASIDPSATHAGSMPYASVNGANGAMNEARRLLVAASRTQFATSYTLRVFKADQIGQRIARSPEFSLDGVMRGPEDLPPAPLDTWNGRISAEITASVIRSLRKKRKQLVIMLVKQNATTVTCQVCMDIPVRPPAPEERMATRDGKYLGVLDACTCEGCGSVQLKAPLRTLGSRGFKREVTPDALMHEKTRAYAAHATDYVDASGIDMGAIPSHLRPYLVKRRGTTAVFQPLQRTGVMSYRSTVRDEAPYLPATAPRGLGSVLKATGLPFGTESNPPYFRLASRHAGVTQETKDDARFLAPVALDVMPDQQVEAFLLGDEAEIKRSIAVACCKPIEPASASRVLCDRPPLREKARTPATLEFVAQPSTLRSSRVLKTVYQCAPLHAREPAPTPRRVARPTPAEPRPVKTAAVARAGMTPEVRRLMMRTWGATSVMRRASPSTPERASTKAASAAVPTPRSDEDIVLAVAAKSGADAPRQVPSDRMKLLCSGLPVPAVPYPLRINKVTFEPFGTISEKRMSPPRPVPRDKEDAAAHDTLQFIRDAYQCSARGAGTASDPPFRYSSGDRPPASPTTGVAGTRLTTDAVITATSAAFSVGVIGYDMTVLHTAYRYLRQAVFHYKPRPHVDSPRAAQDAIDAGIQSTLRWVALAVSCGGREPSGDPPADVVEYVREAWEWALRTAVVFGGRPESELHGISKRAAADLCRRAFTPLSVTPEERKAYALEELVAGEYPCVGFRAFMLQYARGVLENAVQEVDRASRRSFVDRAWAKADENAKCATHVRPSDQVDTTAYGKRKRAHPRVDMPPVVVMSLPNETERDGPFLAYLTEMLEAVHKVWAATKQECPSRECGVAPYAMLLTCAVQAVTCGQYSTKKSRNHRWTTHRVQGGGPSEQTHHQVSEAREAVAGTAPLDEAVKYAKVTPDAMHACGGARVSTADQDRLSGIRERPDEIEARIESLAEEVFERASDSHRETMRPKSQAPQRPPVYRVVHTGPGLPTVAVKERGARKVTKRRKVESRSSPRIETAFDLGGGGGGGGGGSEEAVAVPTSLAVQSTPGRKRRAGQSRSRQRRRCGQETDGGTVVHLTDCDEATKGGDPRLLHPLGSAAQMARTGTVMAAQWSAQARIHPSSCVSAIAPYSQEAAVRALLVPCPRQLPWEIGQRPAFAYMRRVPLSCAKSWAQIVARPGAAQAEGRRRRRGSTAMDLRPPSTVYRFTSLPMDGSNPATTTALYAPCGKQGMGSPYSCVRSDELQWAAPPEIRSLPAYDEAGAMLPSTAPVEPGARVIPWDKATPDIVTDRRSLLPPNIQGLTAVPPSSIASAAHREACSRPDHTGMHPPTNLEVRFCALSPHLPAEKIPDERTARRLARTMYMRVTALQNAACTPTVCCSAEALTAPETSSPVLLSHDALRPLHPIVHTAMFDEDLPVLPGDQERGPLYAPHETLMREAMGGMSDTDMRYIRASMRMGNALYSFAPVSPEGVVPSTRGNKKDDRVPEPIARLNAAICALNYALVPRFTPGAVPPTVIEDTIDAMLRSPTPDRAVDMVTAYGAYIAPSSALLDAVETASPARARALCSEFIRREHATTPRHPFVAGYNHGDHYVTYTTPSQTVSSRQRIGLCAARVPSANAMFGRMMADAITQHTRVAQTRGRREDAEISEDQRTRTREMRFTETIETKCGYDYAAHRCYSDVAAQVAGSAPDPSNLGASWPSGPRALSGYARFQIVNPVEHTPPIFTAEPPAADDGDRQQREIARWRTARSAEDSDVSRAANGIAAQAGERVEWMTDRAKESHAWFDEQPIDFFRPSRAEDPPCPHVGGSKACAPGYTAIAESATPEQKRDHAERQQRLICLLSERCVFRVPRSVRLLPATTPGIQEQRRENAKARPQTAAETRTAAMADLCRRCAAGAATPEMKHKIVWNVFAAAMLPPAEILTPYEDPKERLAALGAILRAHDAVDAMEAISGCIEDERERDVATVAKALIGAFGWDPSHDTRFDDRDLSTHALSMLSAHMRDME